MANSDLLPSISLLSKKIDSMLKLQQSLQKRIAELEISNNELRKQHEADSILLENANKEIEFLKVSYRLASSPETIISARIELSKLIRTIDNCIRMINED